MSMFNVVRAVEELIKIHAPENWARSFVKEIAQTKEHESFANNNLGEMAQYLCECLE